MHVTSIDSLREREAGLGGRGERAENEKAVRRDTSLSSRKVEVDGNKRRGASERRRGSVGDPVPGGRGGVWPCRHGHSCRRKKSKGKVSMERENGAGPVRTHLKLMAKGKGPAPRDGLCQYVCGVKQKATPGREAQRETGLLQVERVAVTEEGPVARLTGITRPACVRKNAIRDDCEEGLMATDILAQPRDSREEYMEKSQREESRGRR